MHPSDLRAVILPGLLRLSPEYPTGLRHATLRSTNGVVREMQDIQSRPAEYNGTPTHGSRIDREVLLEFLDDHAGMPRVAERIRTAIRQKEASTEIITDLNADLDLTASEGAIVMAAHIRYERNPDLRNAKLRVAIASGRPLGCEVCGFDFEPVCGNHGAGYIEVHHAAPLNESGPTTTALGISSCCARTASGLLTEADDA